MTIWTRRSNLLALTMAAVITIAAAIGPATQVRAHAEYERSAPGDGETIADAPARVDVWFTQELFRREGANTLVVTAADGTRVDADDVVIDDADRTHMSVGLRPTLPPGTYTVAWTSLSAIDGDTDEGTFIFQIDPSSTRTATPTPDPTVTATAAPEQTAAPTPTATPPDDDDALSIPWWSVVAALAMLSAAGIGAWGLFSAPTDDEVGR